MRSGNGGVYHLENNIRVPFNLINATYPGESALASRDQNVPSLPPRVPAPSPAPSKSSIRYHDREEKENASAVAMSTPKVNHSQDRRKSLVRASSVTSSNEGASEGSDVSRVRVVLRIRPSIQEDVDNPTCFEEYQQCIKPMDDRKLLLSRPTYDDKEFAYDRVFSHSVSQKEMYEDFAKDVVEDVMMGFNGTIMAYGQTGTGKTYTIFGTKSYWEAKASSDTSFEGEEAGIVPRAVSQIFDSMSKSSMNYEFRVTVSFLEIYMETITDLFDPSKTNLPIREDPKNGVFVDGLTQVQVMSANDVMVLIREGAQNRATSATMMNKSSSRSHVIMTLTVEQRQRADTNRRARGDVDDSQQSANGNGRSEQKVKRGMLTIVDLAGSERVSKSGSEGLRLEEAKKINRSLSALGNCVAALTDVHSSHVPFRDSKLTRLLTDSLGGNSKTCLCATVGPALFNFDETYSTLLFAHRAMAVKNHAVINEVYDFKQQQTTVTSSANPMSLAARKMIKQNEKQQQLFEELKTEKSELQNRNDSLEQEVYNLRHQVQHLQMRPPGHQSGYDTYNDAYQQGHYQESPRLHSDGSMSNYSDAERAWQERGSEQRVGMQRDEDFERAWAERERELTSKYSDIIFHLQMEIRKQALIASQAQASAGEPILDQIVDGLLSIPCLKQRLMDEARRMSRREAANNESPDMQRSHMDEAIQ